MMIRLELLVISILLSCTLSCAGNKKSGSEKPQGKELDFNKVFRISGKSEAIIQKDINLSGGVCKIPNGVTLRLSGGIVRNGTLVGADTRMYYSGKAFENVTIKGTWNVDTIRSSMFNDLNKVNSLKNVFALCSPRVNNTLIIAEGDYWVAVKKNGEICLSLCSNTELVLKGTIRLKPNEFRRNDIIRATGSNITIRGKGKIIGDKDDHLGTDGQWGMGIRFHNAHHSSVRDLNISDCWGDCIYVGGNSTDVVIQNCKLNNARRQGISVTKANGVTINDCVITNVGGSNPQYAIDIEPNQGDSVDNIVIERVLIKDCEGGILVTKGMKFHDEKRIGSVKVKNCNISVKSKYPVLVKSCDNGLVNSCVIYSTNERAAISSYDVGLVIVKDNFIYVKKRIMSSIKNAVKQSKGKGSYYPIGILRSGRQEVNNNIIVEE